jgi:predicted molibdopterin-dependent oxidoreductase YjgC
MWRRGDALENAAWHDVEPRMRDALQAAGSADAGSVRFLVSAHASTEELFVLKELVQGLLGSDGLKSVSISWTRTEKVQPPNTKFKVPATNAPNVNGARDLGYRVGAGNDGLPDVTDLRTAVEGGGVKALYVIDPGPDGSIGDVSWIAAARRSGKLPLLIVQGVVMTGLAAAADVVLPGTAYVEKDAVYTNDQGRVQGAAQAIVPPGEAREDWQILVNLAASLGLALPYKSSEDVRRALSIDVSFARAMPARSWLQASNPSERWKWDFMYQDVPPVKGHNVQMEGVIPLMPISQ